MCCPVHGYREVFAWFTFHSENNHFEGILNGLLKAEHMQQQLAATKWLPAATKDTVEPSTCLCRV